MGFHSHAGARLLLFKLAVGQRAVVLHGRHIEQHFAASLIGMALGDQHADHIDHLVDEFRGAGLRGGFKAAQCFHIGLKLVGGFFGDKPDRLIQRQFRIILQARALILSSTSVMLRT